MNVKLISHSQVPQDPNASLQDIVAYCARVSNPANQNNRDTSEKLVKYLIDHKHWSPLEMVNACVEITTTRDIARQILRHRSFAFQEFSQRYANPTESLGFVTREARMQDPKNRQNSVEITPFDGDRAANLVDAWRIRQQEVIRVCQEAYNWAILCGIAKEQARAVLPEGLTESRLYMSGTLRSFVHYIEVRTTQGTQKEHMEVARAIADAIAPIFPMIQDFKS